MTIMTIRTIRGQCMAKSTRTWAVARAKAHLSAVIDHALAEGPQTITRRGRKAAVVVSAEEWERKIERKGNLAEFFASSPLRGARVRIKRSNRKARKIEL
jgi:prevent-host-death family protein